MERESLRQMMTQQPFVPFEVVTSSGDRYEVRGPDQAMLLKTRMFIALPPEQGDVPDRSATLSLLHIVGVEKLHAA